jgi:hypothetical protein
MRGPINPRFPQAVDLSHPNNGGTHGAAQPCAGRLFSATDFLARFYQRTPSPERAY